MAAREARYRFLARTAKAVDADVIATAHTADDQAETVLLKLARGAGMRGLAGVPRETRHGGVRIIRPMLAIPRKDVVAFLSSKGLSWCRDASNADCSFLRNRVRHDVLPFLESALNPKLRRALLRTADILREEDVWMDGLAVTILVHALCDVPANTKAHGALDLGILLRYPAAARRRVLRLWTASLGVAPEDIDYDTVVRVDAMIARKRGTGDIRIAAGRTVKKRYRYLLITDTPRRAGPATDDARPLFRSVVKIPGETLLNDPGLRVVAALEPGLVKPRAQRVGALPARASLGAAVVARRRMTVRSWRAGDRMQPLGMAGSKKLKNIFIDAKVPVEDRLRIPVFECGGRIVWLPGYRVANGWEVKDPAAPNLQLRVERF
jgi:tRNA(Ile)-lysidine synthase